MSDRIESVFYEARQLSGTEREAYLNDACGKDVALRTNVEALLAADDEAASFLEHATVDPDATVPQGIGDMGPVIPTEEPGQNLGRYKLLQQIGEGGFGVVYMAQQEKPVRRRVALKVIKAGMDTKAVIARFEAERQALAMMDHPHIARVLDAGATDAGRPYFVMELVKGVPITEYADQAGLDTNERLKLFTDVCFAVQHAHHKGIIHRDLKPSNIMVTLQDDQPNVKVIDFGIAKATEQKLTEKTLFTNYGQMIGTPAYMSPEQAVVNEFDVDTRSDVYSLGVLLYELLTGGPPFDAKTLHTAGYDEMRRIIREEQPPKPSTRLSALTEDVMLTVANRRDATPQTLSKQMHGDLDWIIMKAMEKDRARRYESANAFAKDIQRHLNSEPIDAAAPSMTYRLRKFTNRNKAPMAVVAAIAFLLLAGTAVSTWQAIRATRAEDRAIDQAQRASSAQMQAKADADRASAAEKRATDSLAQVAAQRDATERARQDAEAISSFLIKLLQSPDPARDGRTITVAEILDAAVKNVENDYADRPAHRAKLQVVLARTYNALGLSREAAALQQKVQGDFLASAGAEDAATLLSMASLAKAFRKAGRHDEAFKIYEQLFSIAFKTHGPDHAYTRKAFGGLKRLLDNPPSKDEAIKLTQQILTLCNETLGPTHADTLDVLGRLSDANRDAGFKDKAVEIREEQVRLLTKASGPEAPETLFATSVLAWQYHVTGREDEALVLREQVLVLRRKVSGPDHKATLAVMSNLAISYDSAGRKDEALKLREQIESLKNKAGQP